MSSNFLDSFKSSFLTTKSPRIIRNQFQPVPIIPITRSGHSRGHRTKAAVKVMTNTRIVSKNFRTKVIDIMCYRNLINMSSRCQYDKYLMINTPSHWSPVLSSSNHWNITPTLYKDKWLLQWPNVEAGAYYSAGAGVDRCRL